jgi:DNA-binding SARP family transcriptional activator
MWITTLGGFQVSTKEGLLSESVWEGQQPKRLLKAILSHGAKDIQKEVLIEDLWPESDPETVVKTFKVTLHRLRKALEPKMDQVFGSSYVHLRGNLVSLDQEKIKTDMDEFMESIKTGAHKERQGDVEGAIACYDRASNRYLGDFLTDEPYAPWTEWRRRELQDQFLAMLFRWAKLHEVNGQNQEAIAVYDKIILTDPYQEVAYQHLMRLYAKMGRKNQVIRTHEACKKTLWEGLETEPDQRTQTLYHRLMK